MTDENKIKRCLERALQRSSFSVLKKYSKIPQDENDPGFKELKQVMTRILNHAARLGWVAESFIKELME